MLAAPQINCFPSDDDEFVEVVRDALVRESVRAETLDELRGRVEALLKAYEQAGSFLQQPAAGPCPTADVAQGNGSSRGPSEAPG